MHTPTSVPAALVIGAGLLLLGSVLAMSAPLGFYKRRQTGMERASRIASFLGAVAALVGVQESAGPYDRGALAVTLLTVIAFMLALLVMPFAAWILGLSKKRFAARVPDAEDGSTPNQEEGEEGSAQVVFASTDERVDKECAPRDGAQYEHVAEPPADTGKRRRWSLYIALRHD